MKAAYALVNAVIVTVWYVAAGGEFFWPILPLLGWGIGLFFHAMHVLRRPLSEERIRRELDPCRKTDDQGTSPRSCRSSSRKPRPSRRPRLLQRALR